MAKRTSKKIVANVAQWQFEESLTAYAKADAREAAINAKLDEQFTKLREKHAEELADLKDAKEQHFEVVQTFCSENQDSLFVKKKSYETVHGTVGFRTGTPKLKTLKGFTWASVLTLLKKTLPAYVRAKEEPNKELLLADREKAEVKLMLPDIGLEVDQDETFFIDLKKEDAAI